ncbi:Receptor-like protein 12 [Gossypium australe]|uniref:Receptor-like protein 12 n=1 Tax=Gossypium australe TaxID=47621 RepID=A0A5B6V3K1_9ROSI|nr:Receptor-like protein 12 [Gossypium australe]
MLTINFETLRMQENETIGEFYTKICNLSNQAFAIGNEYSLSKLVRKVLRSLLEIFVIKFTTIKEAKDIDNTRIDELKNLEGTNPGVKRALLYRGENSFLNTKQTKPARNNTRGAKKIKTLYNVPKSKAKGVAINEEFSKEKKKRIQCHECHDFGHIQVKCANTLKKKKKSMLSLGVMEKNKCSDSNEKHLSNLWHLLQNFVPLLQLA